MCVFSPFPFYRQPSALAVVYFDLLSIYSSLGFSFSPSFFFLFSYSFLWVWCCRSDSSCFSRASPIFKVFLLKEGNTEASGLSRVARVPRVRGESWRRRTPRFVSWTAVPARALAPAAVEVVAPAAAKPAARAAAPSRDALAGRRNGRAHARGSWCGCTCIRRCRSTRSSRCWRMTFSSQSKQKVKSKRCVIVLPKTKIRQVVKTAIETTTRATKTTRHENLAKISAMSTNRAHARLREPRRQPGDQDSVYSHSFATVGKTRPRRPFTTCWTTIRGICGPSRVRT